MTASVPAARRRGAWKLTLGVPLGTLLVWCLGLTWRVRYRGDAGWRGIAASGRPWVFAAWHGQLLPLAWAHRGRGLVTLVSEHRDGEIITRILERLGFAMVRGSSSRGGTRALLGLISQLEEGRVLVLTPDGPRGPAHQFQAGTLVAAQRVGVPVVAMTLHADRAWRLPSWDAFTIPKPFARLTVQYSEPVAVVEGTARDAAADAPRFEALMAETLERARA